MGHDYRDYHYQQEYEANKNALTALRTVQVHLRSAQKEMPQWTDAVPQRVKETLATLQDMVTARISVLQEAVTNYEKD
jgi:hypothetical protein